LCLATLSLEADRELELLLDLVGPARMSTYRTAGQYHEVIPEVKDNGPIATCAELSADEIRRRKTKRSKIYVSIVYLWTERGPEINNGASAAAVRPFLRPGPGRRW